jgi:transcriptional regulator with XRE-family HTH domain
MRNRDRLRALLGTVAVRKAMMMPGPATIGRQDPQPRPRPLLRTLIGDALRRARLEQRRTLADVARKARVSMPYLSELERGRKEASSEVLAAICEALRIELSDLLAEVRHHLVYDRARRAVVIRMDSIGDQHRPSRPGDPAGALRSEPADLLRSLSHLPADRTGAQGNGPADLPHSLPDLPDLPADRTGTQGSGPADLLLSLPDLPDLPADGPQSPGDTRHRPGDVQCLLAA